MLLSGIITQHHAKAAEVSINTPFVDTQLCTGTNMFIHFTVSNGSFDPGNMFEVQLSDQFGNFSAPLTLGAINGTGSGTISCSIPFTVNAGSNYRIRIFATTPAYISSDNGADIEIFQKPNSPIVSHNSPACTGDTLKMAVTNVMTGVTYNWAGPSYNGPAQAISFNHAQPADGGNYVVTAVVNGIPGCTASTPVFNMLVKPVPNKPIATANSPLCNGDDLLLKAQSNTTGVSYEWWATGFNSTQQNPVVGDIAASQGGKYVVAAVMNGCYSKRDTLDIVVKPRASLKIESNSPVCAGQTLQVVVTAMDTGVTYNWAASNGYTTTLASFFFEKAASTNAGRYILNSTYKGCKGLDTIVLTVNPLPIVDARSNGPVCEYDELALSTPNETNTIYTWTGPGGFSASGFNTAVKNALPVHSGEYIVKAEREGCISRDTTNVAVKQLPVTDALSNSPVSGSKPLRLTVTPINAGTTYNWTGPGAYVATGQEAVIQSATAANSGMYYVTAMFDGCKFTDSVDVKVVESNTTTTLDMFPNPNSGEFKLVYSAKKQQQARIIIYSSMGMLVHDELFDVVALKSTKTITLSGHLPTGIYIMKVQIDNIERLFNVDVYR